MTEAPAPASAKPCLVLIAHSYHAKTRSASFFVELLRTRFEVHELWDDSWRLGGQRPSVRAVNALRPDHVVFWQRLPPPRYLVRVRCASQVWVPMHDDVDYAWRGHDRLRGSALKVLCFSDEPRLFFAGRGLACRLVRYYPPVAAQQDVQTGLRIFFWLRREQPGWPTLKALLGSIRPEGIVLRFAPDPGHDPVRPTEQECRDYRIEVHDGWLESQRYEALVAQCNVFMAPRLKEGIGIAALEALARGMAVVAPDVPCLGPVLREGGGAYLYDPDAPVPVDFAQVAAVCEQARHHAAQGRENWLRAQPDVLDFVSQAPAARSWRWRLARRLRWAKYLV